MERPLNIRALRSPSQLDGKREERGKKEGRKRLERGKKGGREKKESSRGAGRSSQPSWPRLLPPPRAARSARSTAATRNPTLEPVSSCARAALPPRGHSRVRDSRRCRAAFYLSRSVFSLFARVLHCVHSSRWPLCRQSRAPRAETRASLLQSAAPQSSGSSRVQTMRACSVHIAASLRLSMSHAHNWRSPRVVSSESGISKGVNRAPVAPLVRC